jgi:hypothetical protein
MASTAYTTKLMKGRVRQTPKAVHLRVDLAIYDNGIVLVNGAPVSNGDTALGMAAIHEHVSQMSVKLLKMHRARGAAVSAA